MKKIAFYIAFLTFVLLGKVFAQETPSMEGKWYCHSTQEMFVISADSDGTVNGKGVFYSKGNQRFRMLQISTQTPKEDASGNKVYYLKVYDPKNINLGWELTANNTPGSVIVHIKKAGSQNISFFGNMKRYDERVNVTSQSQTTAYDEFLGYLFNLQTKFTNAEADNDILRFEGAVEGTPDRVLYKSKYANVVIDPNTHKISFNHSILGNVTVKIEHTMGWELTINATSKKTYTFQQF